MDILPDLVSVYAIHNSQEQKSNACMALGFRDSYCWVSFDFVLDIHQPNNLIIYNVTADYSVYTLDPHRWPVTTEGVQLHMDSCLQLEDQVLNLGFALGIIWFYSSVSILTIEVLIVPNPGILLYFFSCLPSTVGSSLTCSKTSHSFSSLR